MKGAKRMKGAIVALAVLGLCLPEVALAAGNNGSQQPGVVDVAMMDGGVLLGQVVDPQGQPMADAKVALWSQGQEIASTTTDVGGYFAVKELSGGVYQIAASEGCGSFRLWSPGTAPPTAQQGALIVGGQDLVRGGMGMYGAHPKFWLKNPWICAGLMATAVAVPVAVHNSKRPKSP